MSEFQSSVKSQFALFHLNGIVLFRKTLDWHIEIVYIVLSLVYNGGAALKVKKCSFFKNSFNHLWYFIRFRRLEHDSHTTKAICPFKLPSIFTGLTSFLRLCNDLRQFIPDFGRIASPLNQRFNKVQPNPFALPNSKDLQAIYTLKIARMSPYVLPLPYSGGDMTLDADACNFQINCIMLQKQPDDRTNLVGYCSRSLTEAE